MKQSTKQLYSLIAFNTLLTLTCVEIAGFSALRKQIKQINPYYLKAKSENNIDFGRSYPRWHFQSHPTRGFDITPKSAEILTHIPNEAPKSYPVWGNNIGCFDKDIPVSKGIDIYLAGDSFTWGYAPYEKKFGTLIEKTLKKTVASCGVTHTGTIHQFEKFQEIVQKTGRVPKTVIVNFYPNDLENNFYHPHTTVIDGFQINTRKGRFEAEAIMPRIKDISLKRLRKKLKKAYASIPSAWDPIRWSASWSIIQFTTDVIQLHIKENIQADQKKPENSKHEKGEREDRLKSDLDRECTEVEIYETLHCVKKRLEMKKLNTALHSPFGLNTKNSIREWGIDSRVNNYQLIFAIIDHAQQDPKLCKFIRQQSLACWSFHQYLEDQDATGSKITWENDGHFNFLGNQLYADFLLENLGVGPRRHSDNMGK